MSQVSYQLQISDFTAHELYIELKVTPTSSAPLRLSMPAWIPGSYMIRDFARHITAIQAFDASGVLSLTQLDKQSWQLEHQQQEVCIQYWLYAFDLSVRANYLSADLLVFNPAASCLAVEGYSQLPHHLNFIQPDCRPHWQLATALPPIADQPKLQFGDFIATDYQHLIDCPLLAAELVVEQFSLNNIPHYLVFAGATMADTARIALDLKPICAMQQQVFGEFPADFTEFWFLNWLVNEGYGGLEHRHSTLLLSQRFALPNPQRPTEVTEDYLDYLALCSHEYFHCWWVKRARPQALAHYQLTHEQYTNQLWLYEGFTSYFDDLSLVHAGISSAEQYLTALSKTISRVFRSPSNLRQSLSQSSWNAWTKFYKQDENAQNAVVSYYAKGALVALCLDAALQQRQLSLTGLMQLCWQTYGRNERGSTEQEFFSLLLQYSQDVALTELVQQWVEQPLALPVEESLALLGVQLSWRAAESMQDLSGAKSFVAPLRDFGAGYEFKAQGMQLSSVRRGGAAFQAGLMAGDLLIALSGLQISAKSWPQLLERQPIGARLPLAYFRDGLLKHTELTLQAAPEQVAVLTLNDTAELPAWLNLRTELIDTTT